MIVDVALAGMVNVVAGVIVRLGPIAKPDQNTLPRLALCRVRVLFPGPPVTLFHDTWTFDTVIE